MNFALRELMDVIAPLSMYVYFVYILYDDVGMIVVCTLN